MNIVWLAEAEDELYRQIKYIGQSDPWAAVAQEDRVHGAIDTLTSFPNSGRTGRVRGTRELVIADTRFVAVYRVRPRLKRVEILHLLHSAQDWPVQR